MSLRKSFTVLVLLTLGSLVFPGTSRAAASVPPSTSAPHTFAIGDQDFLLDGQRFQIRCGELHFARVPREYWRHRLQLIKAMGLNTVCAYLFWNYHEQQPGKFTWADEADAAEFCRIAQQEGLWVILRPGPYACAEWEMGGLPWWLLKHDDIKLRTRDPRFIAATRTWLEEVGRVLGPQQITRGGPILMVQVENEYGYYGKEAGYVDEVRRAVLDGGFDVPLFACNPPSQLTSPAPADLFKVVNFGKDPAGAFAALRAVQPKGPLMCGEFYPGWFDTWGAPHHLGDTPQYLKDLEYMLSQGASFSIYMAHGGTTFGLWTGTDRPFKPDTTSYDYDAPIRENGAIGEKFRATRELMAKHLLPGETLPSPPAPMAALAIPRFTLTETAPVFTNLPAAREEASPRTFEAYDQARGAIVYRTTIPAGPEAVLEAADVHDFAFAFLDGKRVAVMDRRVRNYRIVLPARTAPVQLDLFVYALGRVNFGAEVHDRKGMHAPVTLTPKGGAAQPIGDWKIFALPLDAPQLAGLRWEKPAASISAPAFWRGAFTVEKPADTFLDLRGLGFGVVWVNGRCLGRFWNIGPTQTAYLPGAWLRAGRNEVVVLDLVGTKPPQLAGLTEPLLDVLRPELDFTSKPSGIGKLLIEGLKPVHQARFAAGGEAQEVRFTTPAEGRQFCLEMTDAFDGKPVGAIAEIDLLDAQGQPLSHANWSIGYVSSEEKLSEDGAASNAIDGQAASAWISAWNQPPADFPHRLVIDLGSAQKIGGFRYTPRAGSGNVGRIRSYRVFVGSGLAQSGTP